MNSLSICWESKNDSSSKKAIGICGDWVKGGEAHNFQYTMTPRVMNSVIVAYGTDECATHIMNYPIAQDNSLNSETASMQLEYVPC